MPSKNTRYARNRGYSDIKQMARDGGKTKNFGVSTGRTVDSGYEREKRGKTAYKSPASIKDHWKDSPYEQRMRREFQRPQLSQKD